MQTRSRHPSKDVVITVKVRGKLIVRGWEGLQ